MYWTYVISNAEGDIYVGQTQDLAARLIRHNSGKANYTRGKGPFELRHSESFETRAQAMKREKELKSAQGRKWIKDNVI